MRTAAGPSSGAVGVERRMAELTAPSSAQTGCLASKEDRVTEACGHSPQSFSVGGDGHADVSLGRAAFVQRADIVQRVGDDSAAVVVGPVVRSDEFDGDIEARIAGLFSRV